MWDLCRCPRVQRCLGGDCFLLYLKRRTLLTVCCLWLEQQWDSNWSWFYQEPAAVHMFSANATEDFPAHGTFNFDQGYPSP